MCVYIYISYKSKIVKAGKLALSVLIYILYNQNREKTLNEHQYYSKKKTKSDGIIRTKITTVLTGQGLADI